MNMPLEPTWLDIAIRLLLTLLAGAALGINRGIRGRGAGFRTTILVGLAAAVAMIQTNILLPLDGRTTSSFGTMDFMRLPLGILTGVGFIGGGCILKRGELITGVTTAATLWTITVIGLCFGGGQLSLGIIATFLSIFTLWTLKWLDVRIPRDHHARVIISTKEPVLVSDLNLYIQPFGYQARFLLQRSENEVKLMEFEIHWIKSDRDVRSFDLLKLLEQKYNVRSFELTAEKTEFSL